MTTIDPAVETVSTRPLRNWLHAWHLFTGDQPARIARGFGLDPDLVTELLADGHPRTLHAGAAAAVADALGVPVDELFARPGSDDLWAEIPECIADAIRRRR